MPYRRIDGQRVYVTTPERTVRRLNALTSTAIEKGGEDRERIVIVIGKALLECYDEAYEAIGHDEGLLEKFGQLGIRYGYDEDEGD